MKLTDFDTEHESRLHSFDTNGPEASRAGPFGPSEQERPGLCVVWTEEEKSNEINTLCRSKSYFGEEGDVEILG